jgi:hypothetical protein
VIDRRDSSFVLFDEMDSVLKSSNSKALKVRVTLVRQRENDDGFEVVTWYSDHTHTLFQSPGLMCAYVFYIPGIT